jgi:hypothetical protein
MTFTPEQAQAQTAAIRTRSGSDSRVVALRHTGAWPGPDKLAVGGEDHFVFSCISDLQMREALGTLEANHSAGILLCDVDQATLGEDVLARLVRRRIHHPQWDEMLRELFAARVVDARILASRPLVAALIQGASAGGYSPAPGGTLDLQSAWQALLKKQLGFEVAEITFAELLRWTTIPSTRGSLLGMTPELRSELARWLAPNYGEAPRRLLYAVESELGSDLVALGLLLGLLLEAERRGVADAPAAAARLEQYFGNEPIDAATRQTWHQAAASLFGKLAETEVFQAQGIIQNLDRLIERIRLQGCAHLSDHSLAGLEQRLATAGEAIGKAGETMSDAEVAAARTALERVAQHRLASDHGVRLRRLQMGLRLVLWLRTNNSPAASATLSQLTNYYSTEGGFLDWARTSVVESDPNPQIKDALRSILERVEVRWGVFQRLFAERLQQWSAQGAELNEALRIEEVLWKVVAPVAREQPALLIVLDGMSQAVFRELAADLMRRNWVELAAPAAGTPRAVLAAIPSVTEVSRRALLCGQLPVPSQGTEKTDFASSDRLLEQVGGQAKPQLFLKGDLLDAGRMGLSGTVLQAIANSRCRLVGVVVNAVDDSLGSADQTSYSWGLDQVAPLHELMRMASEAGRVVILTSDHGHVLDEGSQLIRQPLPETGDRYRLPGGALSEGEMELRGARIRAAIGSDSVVALAAPRCRYQGKRRGYHGGVCPAEMIVPCVVLRSSNCTVPEAWEDLPPYEPEWWSLRAVVDSVGTVAEAKPLPSRKLSPQKQPDLFLKPAEAPAGTTVWLEALLVSSTYEQQARAAVRGAPPVEQLKRFLSLLDQRNGRIQRGHLAQQLGMPLIRVDGLIQNYRRLLNVDGYDVLSYDQPSETIVLNLELLKSQFEL